MKNIKILAVALFACISMWATAAVTAKMTIKVQGKLGDEITIVEDDATAADFSNPNNGPKQMNTANSWCLNIYAMYGTTKMGAVAIPDVEGLKLQFKSSVKEGNYTMSFSDLEGTQYFLQKGEDAANLIPMTTDYAFSCTPGDVVEFTIVKQVAPQKDYTRENLTVDNWYTICVPGGVDATEYAPVMDVYTVGGYNAAQGLAVDPLVGAMQPGVPYIFLAKATEIAFNYNGEVGALGPQEGANYLTGTFEDMQTENVAYVVANNMLNWAAAGTTVPAYRAYLNYPDITDGNFPVVNPLLPAPGRKFLPAPKGVTTDLEGATVNGLQNGTYMVNGQLVIVKDGKTFNVLGL